MQVHISPSMRQIIISTSPGFLDPLKMKGAARYLSYRCIFWTFLFLAFSLPFLFITSALITLDGVHNCTSLDCFGRKLGPKLSWRRHATKDSADKYSALLQYRSEKELTDIPDTIEALLIEARSKQYDMPTLLRRMKSMVEVNEEKVRAAKLQEALYRHYASSGVPKGLHCLALKLTGEYSSNARARQDLPSPDLAPRLTDPAYHHLVVATDNVLAAAVVVTSTIRNAAEPEKIVFHVITDKKTHAAMHAWFALNPLAPAIVEVKGVHQFEWLIRDNVPVLEAMASSQDVKYYYHGDHTAGANISQYSPTILASYLQARSPKYISIMNHLRIYLPYLFPELEKVVFLDDDVVVQKDLSPLWDLDLNGKVNGAVETCHGDDTWVMSKTFKNYFNFSHPIISSTFAPDKCAWAYGMNVFDLQAWRKADITRVYHYWQKQNLQLNLTLWRLGTLPPALIAFDGNVHPIPGNWHMLGLGYNTNTNVEAVENAAVIHYNGQAKPWLDIAFPQLRPFWSKYVNFSDKFIRQCNILDRA
ncbi:probable galacturonosyltransferase 13 isoform X2 [Physcomitrium patens]|uniref:Hexosyltransferase n=1 Tax=Physcomitrium patens TaxID=3218 RepID=A0A2K1IGJ5_PHYPA|nr:probable galacturonosyltransferase 13 isoform X2 [Physcomitrium patens]PNR28393.1 hypothetical protein PHYPA_028985 [Physcomitrium patens]|eukprot:XP_024364478.1 probable galacturonosyltransferase 13 isoform X2 [Physcomitrella patens]